MLINHGIFYEFIPNENGVKNYNKIVALESVTKYKTYTMLISTNGGLWRYEIGDNIIFTSLKPYKIKIIGRTTSFINAFGEELSEYHANEAMNYACKRTNSVMNEYIGFPFFYNNQTGCHEWFIEFKRKPKKIQLFNTFLDEKLKMMNSDYETKRNNDVLLKSPIINILEKNFFYNFLKTKNKLGGQNKIQRLHNNRDFIIEFMKK